MPDAQVGAWGSVGTPCRNPLTPRDTLPLTLGSGLVLRIPFPSLWGVDYFSQLLRGRARDQVTASRHLPQTSPRGGPPKACRQHSACLICATGLPNRLCSPFSACSPSSSSPGIRSSSLAGPVSSPLGETWGT